MTEVAATVQIAASVAKAIADVAAMKMKIEEGVADYNEDIARRTKSMNARVELMTGEMKREKAIGVASLEEKAAGANFESRMADMKAAQTASSSEAAIGASGVRASGSALLGAQQTTDIAYAAADRTAEAGAAGVRLGGMELGNRLESAQGQKSLLTMESTMDIRQQQRKRDELLKNKSAMLWMAGIGGAAGVASSFYSVLGK
jgi:hypothetical protein